MSAHLFAAAAARLRDRARRCRRQAFAMEPSAARQAMERLALRWEIMAEVEARSAGAMAAANDL